MRSQPRYRQLATQLREDISSGKLQPGDQLPTEFELCEAHNISRHTARDALRLLVEDGLIARRPGKGTVVREANSPTFSQSISDFDSLLQYARDAQIILSKSEQASGHRTTQMGLTGEYIVFHGKRTNSDDIPIAMTRIYILKKFAPTLETARAISGSLTEWIEANHPVSIASMTQRIEAVSLSKTEAKILSTATDSPALRTIRRYRDASDRIILLSESLHPNNRFAYEMRLDRAGHR